MISSYDKFYQQYIDSLLNYKKLEKLIAIKRKKKKINKICRKESSNPYKVKTTASPAGLILHSNKEQIYYIDITYIYR